MCVEKPSDRPLAACPQGYADIVGSVVPVHYQSSNDKQNIVGTWITHDGHVWVMLLVNADGCAGTVRFTPVKGAVTSIECFYVSVPQAVSLWITDHCDAGDGLIHLAFKPTLDDGSIPTEDWIRHLYAGNRFKVKWADAWNGLEAAAHVDVVALRDGTGAQDIGKGWVWITVKTPDGADGHDVDGAGLALKIAILPSAET